MKKIIILIYSVGNLLFPSVVVKAQNRLPLSISKTGITRIEIAKNLVFEIPGEYPEGYYPGWMKIISDKEGYEGRSDRTMIVVMVENFNSKTPKQSDQFATVLLGSKQGKAIVMLENVYADIDIEKNIIVLTDEPQTFKLINFRLRDGSSLTEKPLEDGTNAMISGGAKGNVTLSANSNGDVNISLVVEFYRKESRFKPFGLSYKYTLNDLSIENRQPLDKAIATVQNIAKYKFKDSLQQIVNRKKNAEDERLFEIKIKNSLSDVVKLHNSYYSNKSFLKIEKSTRQESFTYEQKSSVAVGSGGLKAMDRQTMKWKAEALLLLDIGEYHLKDFGIPVIRRL